MPSYLASGREHGFDLLRVLAAGLVFYQHGCTLTGHDDWVRVGGLPVGRIGTASFFALAGLLAGTTRRSPSAWLRDRLAVIYPAYWLGLLVTFVVVGLSGYKSFGPGQVVCQFLGVGLFTHPDRLVNVTTWFVSALLLVTVLTYLIRRGPERVLVVLVVAVGVALAATAGSLRTAMVAENGVTYFAAYAIGRSGGARSVAAVGWLGLLAALALLLPGMRFAAAGVGAVALAAHMPVAVPYCRTFGRYGYEWFLVHGVALHAAKAAVGDDPRLVFPLAAVLGGGGVLALRRAVELCGAWASQAAAFARPRRPAVPPMIDSERIAVPTPSSPTGPIPRTAPTRPTIRGLV